MAITNKTLVNNKLGSWLSRVGIPSIIALSTLITGFISLQFFYQQKVDNYFAKFHLAPTLHVEMGSKQRFSCFAYGVITAVNQNSPLNYPPFMLIYY